MLRSAGFLMSTPAEPVAAAPLVDEGDIKSRSGVLYCKEIILLKFKKIHRVFAFNPYYKQYLFLLTLRLRNLYCFQALNSCNKF